MFFYYGKTFESSRASGCIVGVDCEKCGYTYYYELARIGTGAYTAPYGIGTSRASQKAQDQSDSDVQRRLAVEAELVPCPKCNWINEEQIKGYRLGRYRGVGKVAFALGLAGSILSLIVAWFISIGSPLDRWLLPYLLIGGPVTFLGIAVTLLLLRKWMRGQIQPNREFPQEPILPLGTPPALKVDEATQTVRLAKPAASPPGEFLDIQFGRDKFPPLCCECLQTGAINHGYPLLVTKLVSIIIPRCADCDRKNDRQWQRLSLIFAVVGLLIGCALVVVMVRASVGVWIIIVILLVLLGVTAVLTTIFAAAGTAPVKVVRRDRSRGVVRLRFRNPDYVQVVTQQLKDTAQGE